MLYRCFRPLLFRMDPERAHEFALKIAASLSAHPALCRFFRRSIARPNDSGLSLLGHTFPNRIGLAGGLDKNALAPWAWYAFGFGFVEFGTVTPKPQAGNEKPRMFRFPAERAVVNRMGFNNDGADVVAKRLAAISQSPPTASVGKPAPRQRPPFPIMISVGKNATTALENAEDDYRAAAKTLAPHADLLSINISSPNTAGLRTLQTPETAARLVTVIREVAGDKPTLVKFAPELEGDDLAGVVEACLGAGAAGFIATNTLSTAVRPDLPQGGLSGRPLKDISVQRVAAVRKQVGDRAAVIGCGGIEDAATAQAMLNAGADLIQLYTALIYKGPFLAAEISRTLLS